MMLTIAISFALEICRINFASLLLGAFALNSNCVAPAKRKPFSSPVNLASRPTSPACSSR